MRNIISGSVVAVMTLAYSLSCAALLFSGELSSGLGYGFAAALTTAAIAPLIVALTSSFPRAVAGPENNSTAVVAVLVAGAAAEVAADGVTDPALTVFTVLAWMTVATLGTGVFLYVVGRLRLGQAIRFIPYTVLGGFLAATGWYMCRGAVSVIAGLGPTLSNLDQFLAPALLAKVAAGVAFTVILRLVTARFKHHLVLPATLIAGALGVHLALFLAGIGIAEAEAMGWLFPNQSETVFWTPFDRAIFDSVHLTLTPLLAGEVLAVMVVTALAILMNSSGLERAFDCEIDLNQELRVHGLANAVSAAAGGYVGHVSLSRSILNDRAGASGRASGVVVALIVGGFLLAGTDLLGYVPPLVVGALLLNVGAGVVYEWAIKSFRALNKTDYATVILLLLFIANWGFVAGLMFGVVTGCIMFAVSYGRIRVYKHSLSGVEYRSNLERSPAAIAILDRHGAAIRVVMLQGYIFFGSSHYLYNEVKQLLTTEKLRFIVLDFRMVNGIDASATTSFQRLGGIAAASGATVVLTNLNPAIRLALNTAGLTRDDVACRSVTIIADANEALEYCENAIVAAHCDGEPTSHGFDDWLADQLGGREAAEHLRRYLGALTLEPAQYLFHQGAAADSIAIVERGRVGVYLETGGQRVRLRCSEHLTILGEMGLFLDGARSASVVAETPATCHILTREAFVRMQHEHPDVAISFHALVIRTLSQRLTQSNRVVVALQR